MEKTLSKLQVPVSLYYGTKDWVAVTVPPESIINNPWIKNRFIEGSSHQICMDNPNELMKFMLKDSMRRSELSIGSSKMLDIKELMSMIVNYSI